MTSGVAAFSIASATSFGIVAGVSARVRPRGGPAQHLAEREHPEAPRRGVQEGGGGGLALDDAHAALRKVVRASETTREVMPRNHELALDVRVTSPRDPQERGRGLGGSTDPAEDGDDYDYDYDEESDMVRLRRQLKRKLRGGAARRRSTSPCPRRWKRRRC